MSCLNKISNRIDWVVFCFRLSFGFDCCLQDKKKLDWFILYIHLDLFRYFSDNIIKICNQLYIDLYVVFVFVDRIRMLIELSVYILSNNSFNIFIYFHFHFDDEIIEKSTFFNLSYFRFRHQIGLDINLIRFSHFLQLRNRFKHVINKLFNFWPKKITHM